MTCMAKHSFGFVDGHAHFAGFGTQAVGANLLAPPDGNINTIDDLVKELKDWYAANGTDKTMGWIFGMGYDDAVLKNNDILPNKSWIRYLQKYRWSLSIFPGTSVL